MRCDMNERGLGIIGEESSGGALLLRPFARRGVCLDGFQGRIDLSVVPIVVVINNKLGQANP
jgi:hypothetical protein